jgi:hypothetical protein
MTLVVIYDEDPAPVILAVFEFDLLSSAGRHFEHVP